MSFQQYNTQVADRGYAQNRMGGQMQQRPGRVGQAVYYDIVGADGEPGTWDKIKAWGEEKTFGVKRKWLVLGGAVVAVGWYGYYAGWFD